MQQQEIFEIDGDITALHNIDDDLFIGNSKGEVMKLQVLKRGLSDPVYEVKLVKKTQISSKRIGFKVPFLGTSKGVQKILSDKVNGLCFIQHNNAVYVYDFNLSRMQYVIKESKNLTTFVVDEQNGVDVMRQCTILMAVNDKLMFVHYSTDSYRILKEENLQFPEKVSIVKWYRNTVVIGFRSRKKYVKIDVKSNRHKSEHIIDCDSPYLVLIDHEILLRLKETVVMINLKQGTDHFGMMGRGTVHFTFEPEEIATMFPYIVGLRAAEKKGGMGMIEIRTLYDRDFMDTKEISRGGKLFSTCNTKTMGLFYTDVVSKVTKLYILVPISPERQIDMLLEKGNTKEVFELFEKTFEGSDEKRKKRKVDLILKSGFVTLFLGEVPKAFKYFSDPLALAQYDVREVMYFFRKRMPIMFIDQFKRTYNLDKECTLDDVLQKAFLGKAGGGKSVKPEEVEQRVEAKMKIAEEELVKLLHTKRDPSLKTQEQVIIDNTIVHLSDYESIERFLRQTNSCSIPEMREELQKRQNPILYPLLLRSKGQFSESLVELCTINTEMSDNYWRKKVVQEAAGILKAEKLEEGLFFEHLSWIFNAGIRNFQKEPQGEYKFYLTEGMKVFQETPSELSPQKVLGFFDQHLEKFSQLREKYLLYFLESKINNEDNTELYHNELATLYIDLIEKENKPAFSQDEQFSLVVGKEGGNVGKYRQRLFTFLEHSNRYNYRTVLQRLDETRLYNEQCVVHKKLGQHEKALEILICKLKNLQDAEKYCTGITEIKGEIKFVEHHKQLKSKQLSALLKICFKHKRVMLMSGRAGFHRSGGGKGELDLIRFAIKMLNKYPTFFDLSEALDLIPDDVKISNLAPFFERGLKYYVSVKRKNRIGSNLWKTNYVDHKMKLYKLEKRHFVHNQELTCKKCKKKITSAICVYPNFDIVHYNCRNKKNESVDSISNRNFKVFPIKLV